jgi:hypothetical protein
MQIRRYAILAALAPVALLEFASIAVAQTTIEIPPEQLERHMKRFPLSDMSPEETSALMGMMFKSMRGGNMTELTGDGGAPQSAPPSASANSGPGALPGPQNLSVFPQIPPAVAGSKQALGRWMMFQADLLRKIGESYSEYGQELLLEAQGQVPKLDAAKTKKK